MQTIAQQLREEGIKIGEEKGKKEGMEENAKETAKKMLEKGFDLDMIVEITGLKPSEIERLREITN